jgi:hypothetical protein
MKPPEALLISIEKLMLGVTDNLDPLIQLKLVATVKQATSIAYTMGVQDAGLKACNECPKENNERT